MLNAKWKDKQFSKEQEEALKDPEKRLANFDAKYPKLGDRHNSGKPKWSLVSFPDLEPMVRVLEFGAQKYAPHNWKKGLKVTEILDSLERHIIDLIEGKDLDDDSKLPITGHILCNAMFLQHMLKNRPDLDDRHKIDV